ncbi:porin [Ornithobacterium rhinotracheale]|uniref:porin n=1 Tax=Ornithobacterium rhinotracheale TaxID=28251 RepID=UPI00129C5BD2|nr:porin [Ornithobacterium rhinotracheale]MRJ07918.1 porin [Ornithobacterium rhinotracheale]UOH78570.1 porin [Ornithobacterium rhinotracheale]
MNFNKIILAFLGLGTANLMMAQENSNPLKISAYAEVYAQYDANNPESNTRPDFVYSLNRNNEVSVNLALVNFNYETQRVRANLGVGFGSYMNANYAAEKGVLKNIYEANVGVKLAENSDLWFDAGVLPSHIGSESAVGMDCPTLSRSIMAENSPYFETGVRLSYNSPNGQWYLAALALNGWQHIERPDGNTTPAFGYQVTYTPNEKFSINASSFVGNEMPDTEKKMRYFHDLYATLNVSPRVSFVGTFDIGAQQKIQNNRDYSTWYGASLIGQFGVSEKTRLALRGEYYNDKDGVMIASGTTNGFKTFGVSANVDYQILPNLVWRTEVKNLSSKNEIFAKRDGKTSDNSLSLLTSLSVKF